MVFELLFNPFTLKKKLFHVFVIGFVYSILAFFLSYFVFKSISGILMIFLIVLSALPIVYTLIKKEEEIDLQYDQEWKLLKEHTKILLFFMVLFLGITIAFTLLYVILPQETVNTVFSLQQSAIADVNNNINGSPSGGVVQTGVFVKIFLNNFRVLFFCLIFSFLYGTGALFILTWNASVIAAATGSLIKTQLANVASSAGAAGIATYFSIGAFSFFRYMTHGFFEILAYFIAGLAGGIISIAIIKHNLQENRVLVDAVDLILISIGMLVFAALVEVYITPALFA